MLAHTNMMMKAGLAQFLSISQPGKSPMACSAGMPKNLYRVHNIPLMTPTFGSKVKTIFHTMKMATPWHRCGMKNKVRKAMRPFSFLLSITARIRAPAIEKGMLSMRNKVLPRYCQK